MPSTWRRDALIGGAICLDLVNTAGGRTKARDADRLATYEDLVAWAGTAGVITKPEAQSLRRKARANAPAAQAALRRATTFREALHGAVTQIASGLAPNMAEQKMLTRQIARAQGQAVLSLRDGKIDWDIPLVGAGLDTILARAALSAIALLSREPVQRIRECERCSWVFLDQSKNGKRRWCSSLICGNRARVQRHYHLVNTRT